MKYDSATPYIAAFVIFRKDGKIALLLRSNTGYRDGEYGLPSGKVDPGESYTQAAIRESKEEVGVGLNRTDLKHVLTAHRMGDKDETEWVDVIYETSNWQGELSNAEPHKHSELKWVDLDNLPANTIPPIRHYLHEITAGKTYTEYGWDD
jgi:8-oxo-dGTP diphosphatase